MITVCEEGRTRLQGRGRRERQMDLVFGAKASTPIGVAELPLDGTPKWPAASHCVVGDNFRWRQSLGKVGWHRWAAT